MSFSLTGWWSGIVAEADRRHELAKSNSCVSEAPSSCLESTAPSFFSISTLTEQWQKIDQEAHRRLESRSAETTPPITPPSSFSPSLGVAATYFEEIDREAKKRIEADFASSQGEDPDPKQPGWVESLTSGAKEAAIRPYVIGGTNFNRCSPNVQKVSEEYQKAMTDAIKAAQDSCLPPDKLDLIIGEDVFEDAPASESLAASPLEDGKEVAERGREKIESEIKTFCKPLTAYLTFYLVHEIVAGQKIPLDAHERPICSYQEMTVEAMQESPSLDPLWDIYYEHLGKNLSWFALARVRLAYYLLYSCSNFVPNLIQECLTYATLTLHKIVTDEEQLDDRISTLLGSIEQYLILLNSSMELFGKEHGGGGNLDAYKASVVSKMFGDHFEELLDGAIKRKSWELTNQFFPKITFFRLGETSSRKFLRWAGRKISHYTNRALNVLVTLFLKAIVLPTIFRLIVKKVLSEDPKDVYLFKYKLQKTILEQVQKIDQKLKYPKEKKDEFITEVKNSKKLETVAAELTKILWAPSEESPEAIKRHYEDGSPEHKAISQALKNGIIKAGRVIIGTLHDPSLFEDSLSKLLASSTQALLESASRSAPKSFSSLKRDYNRDKRELALATNKLSLDLTDEVIDDAIDSDLEAFDRRTGRIQQRIQQKAGIIAESLTGLLSEIEFAAQNLTHKPKRLEALEAEDANVGTDLVPGQALISMDHFWAYLQELVQQMDVQGLTKQSKSITAALQEGLDEALQPLRKQTETIIGLAKDFDQIHRDFYFFFALERELIAMLDSLRETQKNLELEGSKKSSHEIFSHILQRTRNVFLLTKNIQNFIFEEEMGTIEQKEAELIDDLKGIDSDERIVRELNFLISPSGPVAELVIFMQRQSLRPFDSEKARNEIRRVFKETNLAPHLLGLIDRMLQFTSRADDADWEKLKPMILEQLSEESPLRKGFEGG